MILNDPQKIAAFLAVYDNAMRVFHSATLTWQQKYDMIFSKAISAAALKLHKFEWPDPDTTYEDDVRSFIRAFQEQAAEMRNVMQHHIRKEADWPNSSQEN